MQRSNQLIYRIDLQSIGIHSLLSSHILYDNNLDLVYCCYHMCLDLKGIDPNHLRVLRQEMQNLLSLYIRRRNALLFLERDWLLCLALILYRMIVIADS